MSVVRLRPANAKARQAFVPPPVEGQVRAQRLHRRLAILGAVVGLAVGTVMFLPATLVATVVANATNDEFILAEAQGTVWDGSALPVLTGGKGADGQPSRDASVLPSRLEWHVRPRWTGLSLHLSQDCCLAHGVDIALRRRFDAWQVQVIGPGEKPDSRATEPKAGVVTTGEASPDAVAMNTATPIGQWPMGWLEGRGFPWSTIHPGGLMTLTTHHLSFLLKNGHWRMFGSAQIELRQASSRLTTLDTLGTYRVLIQADPSTEVMVGEGASRAIIWISTLDGALIIDGRGLIGATGTRLRAEAHAAVGAESALNNLLNLIGRRNGALSVISIG